MHKQELSASDLRIYHQLMIKNQNRKSQKRIKTHNLQKNSHFNKKKKEKLHKDYFKSQ